MEVIDPIRVVQNKVLRVIHNSGWYTRNEQIHQDLKVESIPVIIRRFAETFYKQAHSHQNVYISELGTYNPQYYTRHRTPLLLFS